MSNIGDFIIENGVLQEYNGPGGDVIIPKNVTKIGDSVFSKRKDLESVIIPESITEIGEYAFYGCEGLKSVTIPEGITEIRCHAFEGCTGLVNVTIPEGVTEIEYCAFEGCTSLTGVTIPKSVTLIDDWAFFECKSLTNVTIPKSVAVIGEDVFYGCDKLANEQGMVILNNILFEYNGSGGAVTIPEGVTEIGFRAFGGCIGLTKVTIPESVTEIDEGAFEGCTGLTGVIIPKSVTKIGKQAFYDCENLENVTISEGVAEIGCEVFKYCKRLHLVELPRSIRKMDIDRGDALYKTMPKGLPQTTDKLNKGIAAQIDSVWHEQLSAKDWAGLYLFRTSKIFRTLCGKYMKEPADEYLSAMLELLEDCQKSEAYVRAADYAAEHRAELSPERVRALYELTTVKKNLMKENFREAANILEPLVSAEEK